MAKITGSTLAARFRQYEYVPYLWGGHLPETGWDCSGACNDVIGFMFKLAIPGYSGGRYGPGSGHGPVVGDWIQWAGVTRGIFPGVSPLPGDLLAWGPDVHMGMAVNSGQFISAENPGVGTRISDIRGFFPWDPWVLRLTEIEAGAHTVGPAAPPGPVPAAPDWSGLVNQAAYSHRGTAAQLNAYTRYVRNL